MVAFVFKCSATVLASSSESARYLRSSNYAGSAPVSTSTCALLSPAPLAARNMLLGCCDGTKALLGFSCRKDTP